MKSKIGIWLDSEIAKIVSIEEGKENIKTLDSNVEHYNLRGGARSKTPYGTQDAVSETKLLERKKHQLKKYFEAIKEEVKDAERIAIFGPAETKMGLKKVLESDNNLNKKLTTTQSADSMTENQLKALVRDHFKD